MNMGLQPPSSIFCIAFDRSNPDLMACAAYQGQVYVSEDGGVSWQEHSLPQGGDASLRSGLGLAPGSVPGVARGPDESSGLFKVLVSVDGAPESGV